MQLICTGLMFVSEPLLATASVVISATWPCRKKPPQKQDYTYLRNTLPKDKVVPDAVAAKISAFVTEMGLDSQKVLLQSESEFHSSFGVIGSLKHLNFIVLMINPRKVEEIAADFSANNKFCIAHELGHAVADDWGDKRIINNGISGAFSLSIYVITWIAFNTLFPLGAITTHLLGCALAKLTAKVSLSVINRELEFRADHFAASKSSELAEGGCNALQKFMHSNLSVRKKYFENAEKLSKKMQSNKFSLKSRAVFLIGNIFLNLFALLNISKEGNNRFDFDHPPLTERLRRIQQLKNVNLNN